MTAMCNKQGCIIVISETKLCNFPTVPRNRSRCSISKLNTIQRFDFSYRLCNLKVGRYIVSVWKVILAFKLLEQYVTSIVPGITLPSHKQNHSQDSYLHVLKHASCPKLLPTILLHSLLLKLPEKACLHALVARL